MKDDGFGFGFGIFVGAMFALVIILSFVAVATTPNAHWKRQAIEHHAAQYNPTNGSFEWIVYTNR